MIFEKIEKYIIKNNLIQENDVIVIGLSGGPDSVFLLHVLISLQKKYNLTLIAAHLNHEWRPEANAEEELCRTIAAQCNIPFVSERLSSLSVTKKYRGSQEEFARNARRQFLEKVLHEHNAQTIALGHHAQDQQETFFIRLIRGTSLAGLIGMHPRNGLYIRPLLETNKKDILAWLNQHSITYATDLSNESDNYLRNRIRSKVLPALNESDDRWNNNFLTTINRLQQENDLLNDIAQSTLHLITQSNDILDIKQFICIHPSLHHRILILWLIKNNVQFPVTQTFLDEIIRFLLHDRGGTHVIHEEWKLVKKQGKCWIEKK